MRGAAQCGCATLADVLYELGSDHFCMERERENCQKAPSHLKEWCDKDHGRNHASMATVDSGAGGCGKVHAGSRGGECESAMCRLRT